MKNKNRQEKIVRGLSRNNFFWWIKWLMWPRFIEELFEERIILLKSLRIIENVIEEKALLSIWSVGIASKENMTCLHTTSWIFYSSKVKNLVKYLLRNIFILFFLSQTEKPVCDRWCWNWGLFSLQYPRGTHLLCDPQTESSRGLPPRNSLGWTVYWVDRKSTTDQREDTVSSLRATNQRVSSRFLSTKMLSYRSQWTRVPKVSRVYCFLPLSIDLCLPLLRSQHFPLQGKWLGMSQRRMKRSQ